MKKLFHYLTEDAFKIHQPAFNINNTMVVARPGLPFILGGLIISLIFWVLDWTIACQVFLILTIFSTWFFRDPHRETPPEGFGLSPADGQIIRIEQGVLSPMSGVAGIKISIFMNLFSVHVNRLPCSGELVKQEYFPGTFLNAAFDKASLENERNSLLLRDESGREVTVVQVAGLIARRIVSWVNPNQNLVRGQRFGMIRFGSRVDLYLPPDSEVMVALGQKVLAGWSPIWRYPR